MTALQLTTTLLGIGLALIIIWWTRRDALYLGHGVFWMMVAMAAIVLGAGPKLFDAIGYRFGVSYPPALLLLLAVLVLMIKALHSDLVNTRIRRNLRRLNQNLALQEQRLKQLEDRCSAANDTQP